MLHNSESKRIYICLTLVLLIFISTQNVFAKGSKNVIVNISEDAIGNLKSAIKSDNPGLRKSGIYFAGKHSVNEVSETLLEQLKVEADPNLRILILRVLYIVDNDKYVDDISYLAINDDNIRVRKMASAIHSVIQIDNSPNMVEKSRSTREFK